MVFPNVHKHFVGSVIDSLRQKDQPFLDVDSLVAVRACQKGDSSRRISD